MPDSNGSAPEPSGLDYQRLTSDERRQIVEQRLRALEIEHFQHSQNLAAADAQTDPAMVEAAATVRHQSKIAMVTIEGEHARLTAELNRM